MDGNPGPKGPAATPARLVALRQALGRRLGRIAPGHRADLVAIDDRHPVLAAARGISYEELEGIVEANARALFGW